MMKAVWKFRVGWSIGDEIRIEFPINAEIVRFALQDNEPTLWALVDPVAPREFRTFVFVGTGWETEGKYIGTVERNHYVWHLFEGRRGGI